MTGFAWLLLLAAVALSGVDLVAVVQDRRPIEQWAKPAATWAVAGFLVVADVGDVPGRWWMVGGFVVAGAGDVLLFEQRFIQGLGAFAVAQVAMVWSLTQRDPGIVAGVIGLGVVAVFLNEVGRPILDATARSGSARLRRAVVGYVIAISTLVAMGFATRSAAAAVGASSFAASDGLVAWRRLVEPHGWMAVASRALYRVALVLLAVSFVV